MFLQRAHNTHLARSVHVEQEGASDLSEVSAHSVAEDITFRTHCILHEFYRPFQMELDALLAEYSYPPMRWDTRSKAGRLCPEEYRHWPASVPGGAGGDDGMAGGEGGGNGGDGGGGGSSSSSRSSEVLASIPSRPKQRGSKLKGSADEEDVGEELIPAVPRPRLTKGVGSNVRSSADEEEAMDEEPAAAVAASRSRPTKGGGFKPSKANKPKQKKGKKQKPK